MGRLDTITESNGPDRFNVHPGCSEHHAGVRTGIKDYCCCCDPCSYQRHTEAASEPAKRHCCRCIPRWIMAKFTGDHGSDCCRNIAVILRAVVDDSEDFAIVTYSGSIGDYAISVSLSSGAVGAYEGSYEAGQCRWTVLIPALGIDHEVEIDHVTVTCLGVPDISITGVTMFGSCTGTLSLVNYATVKVPFQSGKSLEYGPVSLTVPFPAEVGFPPCETLPRNICVTKKHNPGNRERPLPSWVIQWSRAFEWDDEFVPYYDAPEDVLGQWVHYPVGPYETPQTLRLVWDGYEFWIVPTLADGEDYQRSSLTSCSCDFKILDVRPIDDPSPPTTPGQSIAEDLLGIDYRGGKCGCWSHVCGRRRCVPKYLCGFLFVNNTLYRNLLFVWNTAEKCWVAGASYDTPFDLRICLGQDSSGQCRLEFDYDDYDIDPVAIGDRETILSAGFTGTNNDNTDQLSLHVTTSFDGDCSLILNCATATPCAGNCGSHPDTLYLRLHGWSLPSDYPPPPVTGTCTTNITLKYKEVIAVSGDAIVIGCEYVGSVIIGTDILTATLSLGQLRLVRRRIGHPELGPTNGEDRSFLLQTETCNPYYGYYFTTASLLFCFFGDLSVIFHRWEAEITE